MRTRIGCLAIVLLLAGIATGFATATYLKEMGRQRQTDQRLNGAAPIRPAFLRDPPDCSPPTVATGRLDKAMIDAERAAAIVDPSGSSAVHHNVVSYFAWGWQIAGGGSRCAPADAFIAPVAPLLDRYHWPQGNTEKLDLQLVERLPPSPTRARGLAEIAFLPSIPPSMLQGDDARPYARQLLGDQGIYARPWAQQAAAALDADTRLGTGAAYLAVATAPSVALPRVAQAMRAKLDAALVHPDSAYFNGREIPAIASPDADRLIELGYALARGGPVATAYAAPIVAMLDHKIARSAPPFGLLATPPTEFCRIARHIGGAAARAAITKPFCATAFKGGDGHIDAP